MKAYRISRRYVCLDEMVIEANSRKEAIEKFSDPQTDVNTKIIKNYGEKAKIIGYPCSDYKAYSEDSK